MKTISCSVVLLIALLTATYAAENEKDGLSSSRSINDHLLRALGNSDEDNVAGLFLVDSVKKEVSATNYSKIVKQYCARMRRHIREEFLPDDDTVRALIKLYPADGKRQKQDIAIVEYEKSGNTYRLIQSGGTSARLWLLMTGRDYDAGHKPRLKSSDYREHMERYVTSNVIDEMLIIQVSTNQECCVAKTLPSGERKPINQARLYMVDNMVLMSLQIKYYDVSPPAQEPLPDQWFAWGKDEPDK